MSFCELTLNRPITKPKIIFDSQYGKCRIGFKCKELSESDAKWIMQIDNGEFYNKSTK